MLAEIFLIVIVFYLLYRFVFNFLVPVVKTTLHVRQQFRNKQEAGPERPAGWQRPSAEQRHSSTRAPKEDYIDFEEIK